MEKKTCSTLLKTFYNSPQYRNDTLSVTTHGERNQMTCNGARWNGTDTETIPHTTRSLTQTVHTHKLCQLKMTTKNILSISVLLADITVQIVVKTFKNKLL